MAVLGDAETVMGFRRQSCRDGVTDQNGCGEGAIWGDSQLSGLGDEWGVVLPTRKEGRGEAAGGRGGEERLPFA